MEAANFLPPKSEPQTLVGVRTVDNLNDERDASEGQGEFNAQDYFAALEAARLCCRCMEAADAPLCGPCSNELDAYFPSWTPADILEAEAAYAPF